MDNTRMQEWLQQAREAFFSLDLREIDSKLTDEERNEWNTIYASFRSGSLMQGEVIGVERVKIGAHDQKSNEEQDAEDADERGVLCLTITPYRVKILIPAPLVWCEPEVREEFVLQSMGGAKVEFVVIAVDRQGGCAIASRAMALWHRRRIAHEKEMIEIGSIIPCQVIAVGFSLVTVTALGYDNTLTPPGLSYAYLGDLRQIYRPGQVIKAKIMAADDEHIEFSVKEAAPNPYEGAERRHPVGSIRLATIMNKYKGGVFCRLSDGCTVVCRYAHHFTDDQFQVNDTVSVMITSFSDDHQWLRGKIRGKIG